MSVDAGSAGLTTFSIVVPTRDRPQKLATCLAALARLHYPRDRYEIVVVDDGGRRSPATEVAAVEHQMRVTLLVQAGAGPATARNLGARRARGEVLAFTDDDCSPAPEWLTALAARFAAAPLAAVGGQTVNLLEQNVYSAASQMLVDYLYAYYNRDGSHAPLFTTNNIAVAREPFRAIGGFDGGFRLAAAEDREFCDRWSHAGHRLVYAPEAVVYHAHVLTFRSFCRQHFIYGRGAYHYHERRARRGERFAIEPLRFYTDLFRYPRAQRARHWPRLMALLAVTQVANALGFFWERVAGRRVRRQTGMQP